MRRLGWLVSIFVCLIMFGVIQYQSVIAKTNTPENLQRGPIIDIWDDDVNNLVPDVAYNSLHDEFLVVWTNNRLDASTIDIYARRIASDGSLLSWFCVVSAPGTYHYSPSVAYSSAQDEYLIAYVYVNPNTGGDVWARRVHWNGSWMSNEFPIREEEGNQHYPEVAYNPDADEYLVVYENEDNITPNQLFGIVAQRVKASDGSLVSWRNIATDSTPPIQHRYRPDVAYSAASNKYLIAYTTVTYHTVTDGINIFAKA
jgi:hypothetical protein